MVKVFLHGALGEEMGEEWDLDIHTPREAIRAIDANNNKLLSYFLEKDKEGVKYCVFVDRDNVNLEQLDMQIGHREELHVIPSLEGAAHLAEFEEAKKTFVGKFWDQEISRIGTYTLLGGIALSWLGGLDLFQDMSFFGMESYAMGDFFQDVGGFAIEVGTAMVLQGMIGALTKEPDHPEEADKPEQATSTSFIFQNPGNNITQGGVVPLGYGRLRIGSYLISSAIFNSRRARIEDADLYDTNANVDTFQHVGKYET